MKTDKKMTKSALGVASSRLVRQRRRTREQLRDEWNERLRDGLDPMTLPRWQRLALAEEGWLRCFHLRSSSERSDLAASPRNVGHSRRESLGEHYWVHLAVPDRCFDSARDAKRSAARALGVELPHKRANDEMRNAMGDKRL